MIETKVALYSAQTKDMYNLRPTAHEMKLLCIS